MKTEPLLHIVINDMSAAAGVDVDQLAAVMDFAYRGKRKKPACLDLLIANDAEMAKLNRRHLNKDNPTDVLAFEDGEMEDGMLRLGDIAIGSETAQREAAERGVAFSIELLFYALHGLFHLLDMDDASDADRAKMHQAQAKAMRDYGLNIGTGLF